jgi:DnaJ family protein A protein 2
MLRQIGPGMIQQIPVPCGSCEGTGEQVAQSDRCQKCKGKKVFKDKKTLTVHVAKGMKDGERVVFGGEADQAPNTEPGDIVAVLKMQSHAVFRREGNNLFMRKSLTLLEALTGYQFVIEHLDGRKLIIRSAANEILKPGDVKSIQNEGFPIKSNPMEKGTLYVEFDVVFPASGSLTPKFQKELKKILPGPVAVDMPSPSAGRTEVDAKGVEKEVPAIEEATMTDVDMKEERARHRQERKAEMDEEEDHDGHGHHHHHPGDCRAQ